MFFFLFFVFCFLLLFFFFGGGGGVGFFIIDYLRPIQHFFSVIFVTGLLPGLNQY